MWLLLPTSSWISIRAAGVDADVVHHPLPFRSLEHDLDHAAGLGSSTSSNLTD
jgi:hypothetical protein